MTEMTQTGLSENSAGALSYVTIIPAIIFLVMPPYNKSSYIRFHAWQSVFFTVACIVLWVALIIVRVILSSIPFIGLMIYPLILLFDLGVFILWLVVVLKALNGQKFGLPIIGVLAEKQAAGTL